MSRTRRIKRAQLRNAKKNSKIFGDILMGLYEFFEKTQKPTDEEVRSEFIKREERWKKYCKSHHLTEEASLMFNKEVSISWEKRYKKQPENELTTK